MCVCVCWEKLAHLFSDPIKVSYWLPICTPENVSLAPLLICTPVLPNRLSLPLIYHMQTNFYNKTCRLIVMAWTFTHMLPCISIQPTCLLGPTNGNLTSRQIEKLKPSAQKYPLQVYLNPWYSNYTALLSIPQLYPQKMHSTQPLFVIFKTVNGWKDFNRSNTSWNAHLWHLVNK